MTKSRAGGGGRKPQPTALKVLKGNPGRRPLNEAEPKPKVLLPSPRTHLSPVARREWRRAGAFLVEMGLMTNLDVAALAGYSVAYARWSDAEKALRKYGLMVKDADGLPIQSPYLAVANKAFDQIRVMLVEFGMSPSSRKQGPPPALWHRSRRQNSSGATRTGCNEGKNEWMLSTSP